MNFHRILQFSRAKPLNFNSEKFFAQFSESLRPFMQNFLPRVTILVIFRITGALLQKIIFFRFFSFSSKRNLGRAHRACSFGPSRPDQKRGKGILGFLAPVQGGGCDLHARAHAGRHRATRAAGGSAVQRELKAAPTLCAAEGSAMQRRLKAAPCVVCPRRRRARRHRRCGPCGRSWWRLKAAPTLRTAEGNAVQRWLKAAPCVACLRRPAEHGAWPVSCWRVRAWPSEHGAWTCQQPVAGGPVWHRHHPSSHFFFFCERCGGRRPCGARGCMPTGARARPVRPQLKPAVPWSCARLLADAGCQRLQADRHT